MADNYKNNNFNNNKDDIDEFFAKFDQPSAPQQRRPSNPAGNRNSSSPAPRRSQPQRPQGQRVQGQRPQSQRPQGQRTTVHRNQGNGTASRNPGAARPAANQNSYNAQSSRASATNMRSGNARRSANPRQGTSHNGRDKMTNNPHGKVAVAACFLDLFGQLLAAHRFEVFQFLLHCLQASSGHLDLLCHLEISLSIFWGTAECHKT